MYVTRTRVVSGLALTWSSTRWKTWTVTLWLLAGITAFTTIFIFFFLPETLMANIQHRRACRLQQKNTQGKNHSLRSFFLDVARQTVNDFKLSCMDPVILFVNIHTMLIYGILYLWFELFPFGEPTVKSYYRCCDCDADNDAVFGGIYRFDATQQARK